MGTHLAVFSESFPINSNRTGFIWFLKCLHHCALDESSRIGMVMVMVYVHLKVKVFGL